MPDRAARTHAMIYLIIISTNISILGARDYCSGNALVRMFNYASSSYNKEHKYHVVPGVYYICGKDLFMIFVTRVNACGVGVINRSITPCLLTFLSNYQKCFKKMLDATASKR